MNAGTKNCFHQMSCEVLRNLNSLFPNQKATTKAIHEWCKVVESKKRIKSILEKNFKIIEINRWSYFIEKND